MDTLAQMVDEGQKVPIGFSCWPGGSPGSVVLSKGEWRRHDVGDLCGRGDRWTGRAEAEGVLEADDLTLVSAVSRSASGQDLGQAWGGEPNEVPVFGSVDEALEGVDVLIDYTSHDVVGARVRTSTRSSRPPRSRTALAWWPPVFH